MEKRERHFVLVHGACHGAWCWYKVTTFLRSAGHKVTALDLAAAGANGKRLDELNSISDYHEPLMKFMTSLVAGEKVILVAHSLGGVSVSVAMERFPQKISVAVFVSAYMPGPDFNLSTVYQELHQRRQGASMDTQYTFDRGSNNPPTSIIFSPEDLAAKLYQLSPPEDLTLATTLMRPTKLFRGENLLKETTVTKEKYGTIRRVYIVCDKDNILKEDFQRWMIKNNPSDEVKVIMGSDHMPMFCKPLDLCAYLYEIVESYS
ncbi:methyl jasmonate esterase 1 [Vitis vinifera]|uniref:Salicylic acid-binding protein 2 n=1 Tax=Vitis vinifera TaxID=29760 RepID=A0A438KRX4_VITVI|nr:methyl jasmonate esterase 1 [Vitis vinifera]XP_010646594.2 methyl jasmonate esterase 1 [Vitis vinifera]RVX23967.1 Salicylic acid-binding protein 2 [Vitis vinifera]